MSRLCGVLLPRFMNDLLSISGRPAPLVVLVGLLAACGGSPTSPPPDASLLVGCPATVQRTSVGGAAVAVSYTAPTVSGGRAPVSVSCQPASGAIFQPGSTQVTCSATDAAGQQAGCVFAVTVAAVAQLQQTRFLVFGDSLTEGKISVLPSLLLVESPAHSYPFKLEALLRAQYPDQGVVVLNEGFGGERAAESYRRFQGALSTHRPGAVLLMQGINDLNADGFQGIQQAADAVEELVKEARRAGLVTLVATLPPIGPGPKAGCPECIEPFNARIRAIATAKGAFSVDVHAAWGSRTGLMGADGIHPTEAGYEVIAETFFNVIRQTLEIPGPPP